MKKMSSPSSRRPALLLPRNRYQLLLALSSRNTTAPLPQQSHLQARSLQCLILLPLLPVTKLGLLPELMRCSFKCSHHGARYWKDRFYPYRSSLWRRHEEQIRSRVSCAYVSFSSSSLEVVGKGCSSMDLPSVPSPSRLKTVRPPIRIGDMSLAGISSFCVSRSVSPHGAQPWSVAVDPGDDGKVMTALHLPSVTVTIPYLPFIDLHHPHFLPTRSMAPLTILQLPMCHLQLPQQSTQLPLPYPLLQPLRLLALYPILPLLGNSLLRSPSVRQLPMAVYSRHIFIPRSHRSMPIHPLWLLRHPRSTPMQLLVLRVLHWMISTMEPALPIMTTLIRYQAPSLLVVTVPQNSLLISCNLLSLISKSSTPHFCN